MLFLSALPEGGACEAAQPKEQRWWSPPRGGRGNLAVLTLSKEYRNCVKNMLEMFRLKYEERTVFDDNVMSYFLANKEILRWESHFFERKNEYFWTVLLE